MTRYAPHLLGKRFNPRQPYYGMTLAGALSWYSRPYVDALLDSMSWKKNQEQWAKGNATYFTPTNVSNELRGWNHWKSGDDFADIFLYVIMSMIFEKQQPLSNYQHAFWNEVYKSAKTTQGATNKIVLMQVAIEQLNSDNYAKTRSDLAWAMNSLATTSNINLRETEFTSTFEAQTDIPLSTLTEEERKEIQNKIEAERKQKKKQEEKKELTKKQKRRIGIGTGVASLLLIGTLVTMMKRK